MNFYIVASSVIALLLYIPLCKWILDGTSKQNLATWVLWVALDAIATGTLIVQEGELLVIFDVYSRWNDNGFVH